MRSVVMASGDGSTFQAVADNCNDIDIMLLICDRPKAGVIKRAAKLGIRTIVYHQFDSIKSRLAFDLAVADPDLIILAGYMRMIPAHITKDYKIINIHPSLLPNFPGLHTYERVLEAGHEYHGTTVHVVDEGMDTGPIIAQTRVRVQAGDTVESLKERTQREERYLYPSVLDSIARGNIIIHDDGSVEKNYLADFPVYAD